MIYPIEIRDLLFWFAHFELFTPKWSKHIFDEWEEVMARKGISEQEAKRRSNIANQAFPDALVTNYESLISTIDLPDEKDRHVLAAAIKVNANIIVTNNLKDFPKDYLASFGLSARSADDFLADIVDSAEWCNANIRTISLSQHPKLAIIEVILKNYARKENL